MPKYVKCPYFNYDMKSRIVCKAADIRTHTSIAVNYFTFRYCCNAKNWYNCPFAEERRMVEKMENEKRDEEEYYWLKR